MSNEIQQLDANRSQTPTVPAMPLVRYSLSDPEYHLVQNSVSRNRYNYYLKLCWDQFPFSNDCIGKINPYTGRSIKSKYEYEQYIGQRAFHMACDEYYRMQSDAAVSMMRAELNARHRDELRDAIREADLNSFHEHTAELTALRESSESRVRRTRRFYGLALLCLLVIFVVLFSSYNRLSRNYNSLVQEYTSDLEQSYLDGYSSAFKDAASTSSPDSASTKTSPSSSTSSGSGSSPYTSAEAVYDTQVIGNKNSKKYHNPDCSYLPNPENQVPFSSAAKAEAAGYDPCGRCGG